MFELLQMAEGKALTDPQGISGDFDKGGWR